MTETPTTAARPPLWPQPIEVLGLAGEFASGKTLFGLTIAPGPDTLAYDWEKSCAPYGSLGFTRVDVPAELMAAKSGDCTYLDMYVWWRQHVLAQPRGKYRVILLDPASDVESGLADWVMQNPRQFGRTPLQYQKSTGLFWGDVKQAWKLLLMEIANRCETFAFTVHMGSVFGADGKPTGKRKVKGKETLSELASLFLQLERKANPKGEVPAKPAAVVLKSRLVSMIVAAGGEVETTPTLPPRLPVATPATIRRYMAAPPDYARLKPDELAPEQTMSEDDRLMARMATAEAERDAEQAKLARVEREQAARQRQHAAPAPATTPAPTPAPSTNGTHVAPPAAATRDQPSQAQLATLARQRDKLWRLNGDTTDDARKARWSAILAKRCVTSARDLTAAQAEQLIHALDVAFQRAEYSPTTPMAEGPPVVAAVPAPPPPPGDDAPPPF
jgi:hypothetical protein